ncbi:replication factor C subunit 1-like [Lineus longissimus]|uniref:replication factor C subunit 1-like n=1 Tax=Lineus longissimus TaxID=88925 RepID=UPI00315D1908
MDIRNFFRPQPATTAEKNNNSKTVEIKSRENELKKTASSPAKVSKPLKGEETKGKSRSEKHELKHGKRDKSISKKRRDSDESDVIVIEAKETESEKKVRKEKVEKKKREDDFMASLKKEEEEEGARRRDRKLKAGNGKERKDGEQDKEEVNKSSRKSKGRKEEVEDNVKSKSKQKEKNGVDEKKPRKRKVVSESEEEVVVVDESDTGEDVKDTKRKRRSKKVAGGDEEKAEEKPKKGRPSKREEKKKKKKGTILDSDSDGDIIPATPQQKKPRRRKMEVTVVNDSDEEEKPKPLDDMFAKAAIATPKAANKKPSPAKKGTPVSVMDFFGTGTVHRTSGVKPGSGVKRKASESVEPISIEDYDIHDDDDFDETLKLLDTENLVKKKIKLDDDIELTSSVVNVKSAKKSPEKALEKPSLAGKLSAKFKACSEPPRKMSPMKGKSPVKMDVDQVDNVAKVKTPPKGKTPQKVVFTPKAVTPSTKSSPPKAKETPKTSPGKPTSTNTSPKATPGTSEKNRAAYRNYLHREGPRALGTKEIPEGAPNCLEDLTFVVTGVLESLERDEAKSLVEKYGGKVTTTLSKKTSYVVIGRDAGESKMAKAQQFGTKQIDEDGLLDLIRMRPGKRSKYEIQAEKAVAKEMLEKKKSMVSSPSIPKVPRIAPATSSQSRGADTDSQTSEWSQKTASPTKKEGSTESLLWVDKYKPQTMKQIIGQQGEKSNARKLLLWLRDWHKNRALGKKPSGGFNRWNDDGSGHKAALLSGPPGIGKTTTATLVAEEAGFSFIELNASDSRNKKSLQGDVADLLKNRCLTGFLETGQLQSGAAKHCLLMDEVDGMSGNEDRGGMQELIALIKQSKVPIICMCNDRQHLKIRSLANHCFDLRFQRPRVEQIRGAVMSIMYKEGVKIPPPAVNEIIQASNQDIRQVIHNLEMFGASNRALTHEEVKKDANAAKKDFKIGPFDVCRQVFAAGDETAKMTLNDKADLFFNDYNIAPLFVQENYVHVLPREAGGDRRKHLDLLAKAADSICEGDVVSQAIRSKQQWGLLPLQAVYSSVIPGELLRGHMGQMIAFPQWLGKNSSRTKVDRILGELGTHMRLRISANKESTNMEYRPHLKVKLTKPLQNDDGSGVPEVIQMLDDYDLLKDDFDNILEISQWTGAKNAMEGVATKTKSAFTRNYNKESHLLPYAQSQAIKKSRKGAASPAEELLGEGEEEGGVEEEAEEEDDITKNPMIKVVNESAKGKGKGKSTKGSQETSGKGKGRSSQESSGKGKGRSSQESSGKGKGRSSQGGGAKGKGRKN